MVARQFLLCHHGEEFPIEYDSDDGIEVLKFQIFSLTSVVPDDQKVCSFISSTTQFYFVIFPSLRSLGD